MRTIAIPLPDARRSVIHIAPGLIDRLGEFIRGSGTSGTIALVYDCKLEALARRATVSIEATGTSPSVIPLPSGEANKTVATLAALWEVLAEAELDRECTIVALGGGVTGDVAGFAAATYLRGVRLIQVPTTLLAQVDASVGGKTAIDLIAGKNLVGAFHQPEGVLIDVNSLATLPPDQLRSGMAEVVKYGVIADPELLGWLELHLDQVLRRDPSSLEHVIARSCEIKADVVGSDERESGRRAILNYGHTIGHAIETVAGYGHYTHGAAVSIGMTAAGELSGELLGFPKSSHERMVELLLRIGLPIRLEAPLPVEPLLSAMRKDKKARAGRVRFVLARTLGEMEVRPIEEPMIQEALRAIGAASP